MGNKLKCFTKKARKYHNNLSRSLESTQTYNIVMFLIQSAVILYCQKNNPLVKIKFSTFNCNKHKNIFLSVILTVFTTVYNRR